MPEYMSMHVARQILQAIDYLHQRGITHHDLKPDNVPHIARQQRNPRGGPCSRVITSLKQDLHKYITHVQPVNIPRSSEKLEELCRKEAIQVGDTWTKTGRGGITTAFSATVGKPSSVLPYRANSGYCRFTDRST